MRIAIVLCLLWLAAAAAPCRLRAQTEAGAEAGMRPRGSEPAVRMRRGEGASRAPSAASRAATGSARARRGRLDAATPADDGTFRPTVIVRGGSSQGSGTVIASVDGDTLVLTASHVVHSDSRAPLLIELHRYNLGLEQRSRLPGRWPRRVRAELVAADVSADLAIVRVRGMVALPFVAKLFDADQGPLPDDAILTSVGIDLGEKLSSWTTELVETASFQLNDSDVDRPFLITARTPEHGRSGGGLFTAEGRLVGVCVGHAEIIEGSRMGVFSAIESVQRIVREHDLAEVLARSAARHEKRKPVRVEAPGPSRRRSPSSMVTPTRSGSQPPAER